MQLVNMKVCGSGTLSSIFAVYFSSPCISPPIISSAEVANLGFSLGSNNDIVINVCNLLIVRIYGIVVGSIRNRMCSCRGRRQHRCCVSRT